VIVILFFQGLASNIKPELPLAERKKLFGLLTTFLVIVLFIITFTVIIARFYLSNYKNQYTSTTSLFPSNEVEFLKVVRNKIAIGLENIQNTTTFKFQDINLLTNSSIPGTMLDFFPSEIKQELQTKIRNNTIFTLIEIAYQDPTETNPIKLSKSLNIPLSNLSRERKKLITLNYEIFSFPMIDS
jgi:hypothetical protein